MSDQDQKKSKTSPPTKKTKKSQKTKKTEQKLKSLLKKAKARKIAQAQMQRAQEAQEIKDNLPSNDFSLPLIPIREGVLFPSTELVLSFGRKKSLAAIEQALKGNKLVVLATQKKPNIDDPQKNDLYQVGTLALIERTLENDDTVSALVRGISRAKIMSYVQFEPFIQAQISKVAAASSEDKETQALADHLKAKFNQMVHLGKPVEFLNFIKLMSGVNTSEMVDQIASTLNIKTPAKQKILENFELKKRIKQVIAYLNHEMKVLEIEKDVVNKTQEKFNKNMRQNILRERLNTIKKELGESDDIQEMANDYQAKLQKAKFSPKIKQKVKKEISRLEQMSPNNPESGYLRTWLDTIFDLPWGDFANTQIDLKKATQVLDQSHYGLKEVKDRVLEYIAVLQLQQDQNSEKKASSKKSTKKAAKKQAKNKTKLPTILCFVGPPGVGKTSIGRAIAQALGREFTKISLGGIRDEAEIRGHRRTYVGAMTGRIIKGILQAESMNPVFILDEIDKVGKDFRGDPSAALLEVLDPEQNQHFEDHYLDVPFDLSHVMFITTANTLDTIPPALKDRLEIIKYPGYTYQEKFEIAKRHLLDKVLAANALTKQKIKFNKTALQKIIHRYTKEAGVRELERKLGKICRKVAKKIVESKASTKTKKAQKKITINKTKVKKYLGPEEYDLTFGNEADQVGVASGLAWTKVGGDLLFIEVALTPGEGKIRLTGKLGDVMKESAQAALTFVKAHAKELKIKPEQFKETDVHIHVPEGAVPKDGPSAGITMATAIASAFTKRTVKKSLAMTGEITLRGQVLRIGGLKEKAIAAHLAGIKKVIIPQKNERNLEEIPKEVKKEIKFIPVSQATQVLELALNK